MDNKIFFEMRGISKSFQPMNANFGILPPLDEKNRDKALKKQAYSNRAIQDMKIYKEKL